MDMDDEAGDKVIRILMTTITISTMMAMIMPRNTTAHYDRLCTRCRHLNTSRVIAKAH